MSAWIVDWAVKYWVQTLIIALTTGILAVCKGRYVKNKQEKKMEEQRRNEEETRRQEEFEALRRGLQNVLRGQIIQMYNHCIDRGNCRLYEKDNLGLLYECYHNDLKGNGTVTEVYKEMMEMATK